VKARPSRQFIKRVALPSSFGYGYLGIHFHNATAEEKERI